MPVAGPGYAFRLEFDEGGAEIAAQADCLHFELDHDAVQRLFGGLVEAETSAEESKDTERVARLWNRKETAEYLGISSKTFDRYVKDRLKGIAVGGRVLYDRAEVDTWLEAEKGNHAHRSPSKRTRGRGGTPSGSRSGAGASISPRAREILKQLQ